MEANAEDSAQQTRRITKAFHRKSRNGCQTCRTRRVKTDITTKCDERKPICLNCETRGVACTFAIVTRPSVAPVPTLPSPSEESDPANDAHLATKSSKESETAASTAFPIDLNNVESVLDLPESKSRRLLELRLLNHWSENMTKPFAEFPNSHLVTAWAEHVPRMGFQYENVLYMMFACSATNLLRRETEDPDIIAAADVYLGLALREQYKAVQKLSIENADPVCFTAMLLLITSVARLWKRDLEPYSPPMEWLRLGAGAGTVLRTAKEMLKEDPSSKVWMFINAPPVFNVDIIFAKKNMDPFSKILESESGHTDPETLEAYEKTLSFVGYVYQAVDNDEPVHMVARKIFTFPIFVPRLFIELVEEKMPCALVILAHYFALMARHPSIWWIGKTPKREIQAIYNILPEPYQSKMRWPAIMAGLATS
ncbi:hypothetical protein H2200_003105 [Cladophialophora chaetospira]|uniref:Zn(2)-C6 fungal-type domain-containing protein n=1 Tax=Cladophialophora chaetospira TaxID=386627 RepID=A0AA38XHK8_9EURO|nr:hypothetical protein H2200_003105 [Cladophialophora chaetospira]